MSIWRLPDIWDDFDVRALVIMEADSVMVIGLSN